MKKYYIGLLLIGILGFTACESDDDSLADPVLNSVTPSEPVAYTSGSADFSTFVAIGNSLTAGYSDGALFAEGQDNSFPNILAQQFALAGGGTFTQPLMDETGGFLLGGNPVINPITGQDMFPPRLIFDTANQVPIPASGTRSIDITNVNPGPYNNMGVPGAKSFHLLAPGYGNIANFPSAANPYFVRMASTPDATVLEDALAMNPTFFSLWIGNNDVLGYATSGGDGSDPITPVALFTNAYNALAAALSNNGTRGGIVANIPSVTDAPFFTTVPHNAVPLDAATAAQLNAAFAPYNGGIAQIQGLGVITAEEAARRTISFSAGQNAVLILDENLTNLTGFNPALTNMRQATADDLLILTSRSFIGTEVGGNPQLINGVSVPLGDKWVLTPEEQTEIADATTAFNQIIADAATQNNLAFLDANALLNEISTDGISVGGATITGDYVLGGGFSLDGVHPSPRGYALAANYMITAINTKYGSNLPQVNPVDYTGIYVE